MSKLRAVIIPVFLSGVLGWVGYAALHVPPVRAEVPATETAAGRSDGEDLFQAYITWVAAAHVHAALHGEDAQLPSQF
ncbi:hypothetical protein LJR290_006874 [Variovorax sp. LjRoot290]|uniref:hypothetical protein n=1 Tax=unclassified Variovorax TaxID=663243 RepID=UPI003ECE5F97